MSLLLTEMLCVFVLQEKLNSSSSRAEISLGKKLTRDMVPEIEKEHKVPISSLLLNSRYLLSIASTNVIIYFFFSLSLLCQRKEKLLKKQHRQALLLDNHLVVDGVGGGRSRRDRKPVRYTFGKFMTLLGIHDAPCLYLCFPYLPD